jgi:transcriptional regulator with XRE-family HTH domain
MSTDGPRLAVKVRELRRREGVTQARMAARLGVSASYLNLIENGRRPLTAQLLLKLAQEFQVDLREFAADDSEALAQDLAEAFGDPMFDAFELKAADVRELAAASPSVGRAITSMYDALRASRQTVAQLRGVIERARAGGVGVDDEVIGAPDTSPSEEVSATLQRHLNYFP